MSSEDINLVPGRRIENGLTSPLVFQDDFNMRYPAPKTRELGGFIDDKMFAIDRDRFFPTQGSEFRRNVYADRPNVRDWRENRTPSTDESDDDEDDDDDDDDAEVERLVGACDGSKGNSNAINE